MARSYEELSGGLSRKILFRSERYYVGSLFQDVKPIVRIDARNYVVRDLSMSGLLILTRDDGHLFHPGQEVEFCLLIGGSQAHNGAATITRIEQYGTGAKIGLQLTDDFINVPALLELHEDATLEMMLSEGVKSEIDLVPTEYRQVCSDIVFWLRRTREILDRLEKRRKNRDSIHPGEPIADQLESRCEAQFIKAWTAMRDRANKIVQPLMNNPKVTRAIKRFTETVVTPELTIAPNWKRAYEKPLGYPGDFELMNYFYSGKRHGDSAYIRLLHHVGNIHPISTSMPKRMNELKRAIARTVSDTQVRGRSVRITSLGAGPAREICEYLSEGNPCQPVKFSLVDQDEQALAYAFSQVFPYKTSYGERVKVECKFLSFGQMLRNPELIQEFAGQDLIYSAGLFDYLNTHIAKNLIRALFTCINEGGTLIVGNLKLPNDSIWGGEFLVDWSMIYRTKKDMEELASAVRAPFELRTDPSGYNYLLSIMR